MRYRTHIALLAAGGVTSSALGLGVFAWPAWQDRTQADAERADLEQRIAGLSDKTAEVTVLADELDRRRNALRSALKYIPETPDIATLIGTLSLPADGVTVLDQTFTAGAPEIGRAHV